MSRELTDICEPLRELRSRFQAHVEPHRRALWGYCLRLTGSVWDAEDLVQDTLQRAFAGLANLWQPVNARAWLFRIASHAWIDCCRAEAGAELCALDETALVDDTPPEHRVLAREAVERLVHALTPLQRVVFLLSETLDYRAHEVAALLDTTPGAVKAALHRARGALAAAPAREASPCAALSGPRAHADVVRRYIAAFDARDPDALAALLHERAVTTIVGSAVELGRDTSRRNSLAEWALEPLPQWVKAGVLDGRDVLFVFAGDTRQRAVLHSVIALEIGDGAVLAQHTYYFTPELLELAAEALGVPAGTHGYQYDFTGVVWTG